MKIGDVKTSLVLDEDLAKQISGAKQSLQEKEAVVIRMALRIGLPLVVARHAAHPPADTCGELLERLEAEPAPNVNPERIRTFLRQRGRRSHRPLPCLPIPPAFLTC